MQGALYRAELVLPWYATEAMARDRLTAAGFAEVMTYHAGGMLCAQARWAGATQDVELPSQVRNPVLVPA